MSVPPSLPSRDKASATNGTNAAQLARTTAVDPSEVSALLLTRQADAYTQPNMNESSDVFAVKSFSDETLKKILDGLDESSQPEDDQATFWLEMVSASDAQMTSMITDGTLRLRLAAGITHEYKALVYLRLMRVTYQMTQERYNNLLAKAVKRDTARIDGLEVSSATKNALKVFVYYMSELVLNGAAGIDVSELLDSTKTTDFLFEASRYLSPLPHMTETMLLYLLLKIYRLISSLNSDEWAYKVGRSLEDLAPESYLHVSRQGINLNAYFKKYLYTLLRGIGNSTFTARLLDFTLFEGFDYWARLFVYLFSRRSSEIVARFGSELNEYINSNNFYDGLDDSVFGELEDIRPKYINYENEYHLTNVNSLSNNNNELLTSQEINEDLKRQIDDLKAQLESLRTTHTEILAQSKDYELQVAAAQTQRDTLAEEYSRIKAEHDTLSMKSNLDNTIKANEEFSERNKELQSQIAALKESVQKKAAKVARRQT